MCVWAEGGGAQNHPGFENQVKDFYHIYKNNGKDFKSFKQDIHMIQFGF